MKGRNRAESASVQKGERRVYAFSGDMICMRRRRRQHVLIVLYTDARIVRNGGALFLSAKMKSENDFRLAYVRGAGLQTNKDRIQGNITFIFLNNICGIAYLHDIVLYY